MFFGPLRKSARGHRAVPAPSHFVTSMTAPVASGWSGRRVGLAPTGKRRLSTAHAICRRGAFVGFDRQGGPNDDPVVPIVMSLIDAGYADHLLFSSDFSNASML